MTQEQAIVLLVTVPITSLAIVYLIWLLKYQARRNYVLPNTRLQVYKRVKHALLNGEGEYLCTTISRIAHKDFFLPYVSHKDIPNYFPELKKVRPKDLKGRLTWWPEGDKQSRLAALDRMINIVSLKCNQ